jgi:hypothetical protein
MLTGSFLEASSASRKLPVEGVTAPTTSPCRRRNLAEVGVSHFFHTSPPALDAQNATRLLPRGKLLIPSSEVSAARLERLHALLPDIHSSIGASADQAQWEKQSY